MPDTIPTRTHECDANTTCTLDIRIYMGRTVDRIYPVLRNTAGRHFHAVIMNARRGIVRHEWQHRRASFGLTWSAVYILRTPYAYDCFHNRCRIDGKNATKGLSKRIDSLSFSPLHQHDYQTFVVVLTSSMVVLFWQGSASVTKGMM
jgi:hypothetical protein